MDQLAADKAIKGAWIAGIFTTSITLIVTLLAMAGIQVVPGIDAYALVDIAIGMALTYGIYRRSRTAATLMVAVFVAERIAAGLNGVLWAFTEFPTLRGVAFKQFPRPAFTEFPSCEFTEFPRRPA